MPNSTQIKHTTPNSLELSYNQNEIEQRIFTIRGTQVMLDRDLAELYQIKTIALNQAVKRNIARFPESFRFQLTSSETNELITKCDRFKPSNKAEGSNFQTSPQGSNQAALLLKQNPKGSNHQRKIAQIGRFFAFYLHICKKSCKFGTPLP